MEPAVTARLLTTVAAWVAGAKPPGALPPAPRRLHHCDALCSAETSWRLAAERAHGYSCGARCRRGGVGGGESAAASLERRGGGVPELDAGLGWAGGQAARDCAAAGRKRPQDAAGPRPLARRRRRRLRPVERLPSSGLCPACAMLGRAALRRPTAASRQGCAKDLLASELPFSPWPVMHGACLCAANRLCVGRSSGLRQR